MLSPNVNYLAILTSGVAVTMLGFAWYSQLLFGKPWMKLMGFSEKSMQKSKKNMGPLYALNFLGTLLMGYVLANFIDYVGAITIAEGLQVGFWAWTGFIAPVMLTEVIFGGKSFQLYLINTGYQLASALIMGAVIAVWI